MKAAVIGHPISHSKSPIIHQYWLKKYDISGSYEKIDIAPENLKDGVQRLIDQGFDGFNVTVPHKETMMDLCDNIDITAQKIGAVNTIIMKNGKLYGQNTDAYGFIQNIKQNAPQFDFKNKSVLILGAGGAAKAVAYGLTQEGVSKIIISNRTLEKAKELQNIAPVIEAVQWDKKDFAIEQVDMIVNATSLGMIGKPSLEISILNLKKSALVTDIVYTPLKTNILNEAEKTGRFFVTGIGMLLHQARPSFEAWTGILPDVDNPLEALVLA